MSGHAYYDGVEPEGIDEQNTRAKREREEESEKREAEEDEKGGCGPFRPFSEWGKSDPEPEPKSSDDDNSSSSSWTGFGRSSADGGM